MRVLVTAASKHGSTEMIANEVVRGLRDRHIDTDFAAPEVVTSLLGYDAVIIGSAVYNGHWMKPAAAFVHGHRLELRDRQVWLFSSGPVGTPPVPATETPDTEEIALAIAARGHRSFPGVLDRTQLGRLERTMVKLVHADEGDFRDWDAVQEWTKSLAEALKEPGPNGVASAGIGLAGGPADQ
jgi:menaquinone-dependent protoporphyrinogen oxidase